MKKIHNIFIEDCGSFESHDIIKKITENLPKALYVTNNISYYYQNNIDKKITLILECINISEVVIIKFYKNIHHEIPEELLYLSEYYCDHFFYKDCYLAYCRYGDYNISIIKYIKADGDISKLKFNITDYNILRKMISDELLKMHTHTFVHMDIKTTNILYKVYPDGIKFGLCDFELINAINTRLSPLYKRYYSKIYSIRYVPEKYSDKFEKYVFNRLLFLIKQNKRIKFHTWP